MIVFKRATLSLGSVELSVRAFIDFFRNAHFKEKQKLGGEIVTYSNFRGKNKTASSNFANEGNTVLSTKLYFLAPIHPYIAIASDLFSNTRNLKCLEPCEALT